MIERSTVERLTPRALAREEALKKLEERAGADARRLFEAFLRKIDKLQEASASH